MNKMVLVSLQLSEASAIILLEWICSWNYLDMFQ